MDGAATAGLRATRRTVGAPVRSDAAAVQSAALAGWTTWLTVAWTATGTLFYVLTPKIAPVIVALSIVAPLLSLGSETRHLRPFRASSLAIALGLTALYLLVNSTWSLARAEAYRSVLTLMMAVTVLFIVVAAHRALHEAVLRAMLAGFLAGYIGGGALLCLLLVGDHAVLIKLMNAIPGWRNEVAWATLQDGNIVALPEHYLNRHAAGLVLLLWPAVLAAVTLSDTTRTRASLLLALAPAAAVILLSYHATSQVALIGGAIMFGLYHLEPRLGTRTLTAGWVVACVAAVPLVFALYAAQLQTNEALFWSARHRLVIWHHTAQKIPEAPLLGAGVSSARAMDTLEQGTRTFEPGTQIPRETNIHAHNAYVQVWYEAGAVGVVLLLVVGLLTLGVISRAPPRVQPLLAATFASHALVAAFGFSVWAPWLLASFVLAAIFASPSVALALRDPYAAD
jgi:O-antigen ligase